MWWHLQFLLLFYWRQRAKGIYVENPVYAFPQFAWDVPSTTNNFRECWQLKNRLFDKMWLSIFWLLVSTYSLSLSIYIYICGLWCYCSYCRYWRASWTLYFGLYHQNWRRILLTFWAESTVSGIAFGAPSWRGLLRICSVENVSFFKCAQIASRVICGCYFASFSTKFHPVWFYAGLEPRKCHLTAVTTSSSGRHWQLVIS